MSQSEVFRPNNGPLLVRGSLNTGLEQSADVFRKNNSLSRSMYRPGSSQSRPGSQGGGTRFGQLSHSSFFARHNPHPGRVRHIKGLLDVPICAVNDEGHFANARYQLQFPPNVADSTKLKSYNAQYYNVPVGSINVNSQLHPVDTISGIQKFVGKPLNMRIFRERAVPKVPMAPAADGWRNELHALTEAVGSAGLEEPRRPATSQNKPRTCQYSMETGRLIPPPSRAMSRGNSRAARRQDFFNKLQNITENPDMENMILQMLSQILQTDDVNAVQAWLVSAGDREKSMVLDMIRAALVSNEEYYKQYDSAVVPERPTTGTFRDAGMTIGEHDGDRLTLDPTPRPMSQFRGDSPPLLDRPVLNEPINEDDEDVIRTPILPDVFKPPAGGGDRIGSRGPSSLRPLGSALNGPEPRLRYTTPPARESAQLLSDEAVWQPDMSHPK